MAKDDNRYHVQRRSDVIPLWKTLTPGRGMTLGGAQKLHKEVVEESKSKPSHKKFNVEHRVHPASEVDTDREDAERAAFKKRPRDT